MFRSNVLPTSSGWMKTCRWKSKYWWMEAWAVWQITNMEGRKDDANSTTYLNSKYDSDIKFELHIDSHVRNWATLLQHIMLNVWCFPICCVCVFEWQVDSSLAGLSNSAGGDSWGRLRQQRSQQHTFAMSRNTATLRVERFQFRPNPYMHGLSELPSSSHSTFSKPQAYYTNTCEVTNQNKNSYC